MPVELQPGGLMLFGPYPAPDGMTVRVGAPTGAVQMQVMCQAEAEALARAYIAGAAIPAGHPLVSKVFTKDATMRAKGASCPVVVIAQLVAPGLIPVSFNWQRPQGEAAYAAGGPLIHCEKPAAAKATEPAAPAKAP